MITFQGTVIGAQAVVAQLAAAEAKTLAAVEIGVRRAVLGGQGIVQGKVSGRPGPRNVTGDFRRSIVGDSERDGSIVRGQIGTNAAQGLRLEFGFVGADSIGRVYNQPPYPYMQPAVPEVTALAQAQVADAIRLVF